MANQGETDTNAEALSESARSAYASAKEGGEAMRDTSALTGDRLEEEAEEYMVEGEASFSDMMNKAEFAIIDRPLAAVGVAFAAGWMISRLFR